MFTKRSKPLRIDTIKALLNKASSVFPFKQIDSSPINNIPEKEKVFETQDEVGADIAHFLKDCDPLITKYIQQNSEEAEGFLSTSLNLTTAEIEKNPKIKINKTNNAI